MITVLSLKWILLLFLFSSNLITYEARKTMKTITFYKVNYYLRLHKRTVWSTPINYYPNHVASFRLLISGDVEMNPGPTTCPRCEKTVRVNSKRLECNTCHQQTHLKCSNNTYTQIFNSRIPESWTCPNCFLSQLPFHRVRDLNEGERNETLFTDPVDFISPNLAILNKHRKHLSVAHLNTQAIMSTFPGFEAMLKTYEFDIITLSETWLNDDQKLLKYVEIPGYDCGFRNRVHNKGGGVGYYVKTGIDFKERKDLADIDNSIENQWIEVKGKNRQANVLIGTIYQPSSKTTDKIDWLHKFDSVLSQVILSHDGPIVITGDFNINLLKTTTVSDTFNEILDTYNLKQHISNPTRHDTVLIDHIISTDSLKLVHEGIVYCDEISDHDAPFAIFKNSPAKYETRYKFVRDERTLSMDDFVKDFATLPLSIVYAVQDVSDKVDLLNKLTIECIEKHAPMRRVKITRPPAPWMKDLNITHLQRERNRLRNVARTTPSDGNRTKLRNTRNVLKNEIRKTKSQFMKKLLNNKDNKEVWKVINKILHPNPKNIQVNPDELNTFFNKSATRTTGKHATPDVITNQLIESLSDMPNSFHLLHATFDTVLKALKSLRSDCSTGHDQIPAKYVKEISAYLASPLTHIINTCISTSSFPDQWKISRVCPIPKISNPASLADYRPISILPILSKVFEKVILNQMIEHIEKNSIYHPQQSGFRKGHSTTTTLLKLKDEIVTSMKEGEITLAVFADFSKAFDTVDYPTLIIQLHQLGFSKTFIILLHDYLHNRQQFVQVNDNISKLLRVEFGVPQGSILGPILFNLYVTLLSQNGPSSYLQYADDTTLLRNTKPSNLEASSKSMQEEMTRLETWSGDKNLCLNSKKTKIILFSTPQLARIHDLENRAIDIQSNGQQIDRVEEFKVLGVHFHKHLTWRGHINKVLKSCMATLRSLKQFKRSASFGLRKSLVQALVLSKIDYCNVIFADAPNFAMKRLQKIERSAASFVFNRYCNDNDLLALNWLPVKERIALSFVKLAHRSLFNVNNWPTYLNLSFKPSRDSLCLRNDICRQFEVVTGNIKGSFRYEAGKRFNDLPITLRKEAGYFDFCKGAHRFYFDCATARMLGH